MTPNQLKGINLWHITPVKGVFSRTQSKELLSSELYKNLQRVCSPQDTLFVGNTTLFQKNNAQHNAQIYDLFMSYLEIDPQNLPDRFVELFDLNLSDPDINEQVVSIFRKARLLDSSSGRVVFIDDKIIIFRNEEQLVHRNTERKLTQAEKGRKEIVTTFNTFEDIYSAIRSQYYTIDKSNEKKDDYKHLQQELLKLIQEISALWYGTKDNTFERRIHDISDSINTATNAKVLAAQLQNLKEISFNNKSIDSNHLIGAKNKLEKRFGDLKSIISIIEHHLNSLEEILVLHQNAIEWFFLQHKLNTLHHTLLISNYNKLFNQIRYQFRHVAPFIEFHTMINSYNNKPHLLPTLVPWLQEMYNNDYKSKHQEKLSQL